MTHLSHLSETITQVVSHLERPQPRTLHDLVDHFASLETLDNPDITIPLNRLRMTEEGTLAVPHEGNFEVTDWSRRQLSQLLGIRWDRWFETASGAERADEVNRRLARKGQSMKLRTSRVALKPNGKAGLLRAFVSPSFSPVPDSLLAGLLVTCLSDSGATLAISQLSFTDRTSTYMIHVGRRFGADVSDRVVGDVAGGLIVRNSGVGYASLMVSLQLVRLVCLNGLTAPVPDAIALRQPHRSFDEPRLITKLTEGLVNVPGKLAEGAKRLAAARNHRIANPSEELSRLLREAHLPKRYLPELDAAYAIEPEPTAFGISQAATRASQKFSTEERFELDRVAGQYLLHLLSA